VREDMKNPFANKKRGLNIIIVGCGKVGTTLVERLSQENHDITVIDQNNEIVQRVAGTYDVMGVTGNGASFAIQTEAGINKADIIIAVTESDELNLLCCTIAKKVSNCAAIARMRNPDYSAELGFLRSQLGLSMIINPEMDTAVEISRLLRLPTALEINSFAKGQAELVKFKIPVGNALHNRVIWEVTKEFKGDILFCGIERDGNMAIPDGGFILRENDEVSFLATPINTHAFFKHIGVETHQVKNCMIVGGGKTSYYLAKLLTEMNIDVKIMELDAGRCETLAGLLPKALVINGDGADEELLAEEGIESMDSFVPLTGLDEENILLTLFAKRFKDMKVITKINRSTFNDVIDDLDMGSIMYPRYMTTEKIIRYVRGMQNSIGSNIEVMYKIFDNRAEALELNVDKDSPVIGKPIMELKLKSELLIACIYRKGRIIIPRGSDVIEPNDHLVIVTTHTGFNDVRDILK
jgi:trk system potassium uptake protein TrkA